MRYEFADCILDTERIRLLRGGDEVPVEPQVFDLLCLLAENPGKLVSKDQLIERVWKGRIVSEATVSARVNAARTAVGDNGRDQKVIRTVQRRGLKLTAAVVENAPGCNLRQNPMGSAQTIKFTTSADGTKIAYASSGSGPVAVRAGHFLTHLEKDWSSPVWGPYLKAISAERTLIRYDQRGTGLSDRAVTNLDVEAYASDLLAVADAAGLETFPLIASSQGVPVAIHFAAHHPERVSRMVFYGGFAQGRSKRDHLYAREEADALMAMIRSGWGDPNSAFLVAFTAFFCPGASKEEIENLVEIQLASTSPENAALIRNAIDQFDVSELLEKVQAPTLVIHASHDALHPVSQGRLIASRIAHAVFRQVESRNHVYLPSDPAWQEVLDAQLAFMAGD